MGSFTRGCFITHFFTLVGSFLASSCARGRPNNSFFIDRRAKKIYKFISMGAFAFASFIAFLFILVGACAHSCFIIS
jgi:hypothetical protein